MMTTNTAPIAMDGLRDGITARKPAGAIAVCLPARPRSTAAGLMSTRGGLTTTIRTRRGGSSFGGQLLRFTAPSTSCAEVEIRAGVSEPRLRLPSRWQASVASFGDGFYNLLR